jgi:hypothetical protein
MNVQYEAQSMMPSHNWIGAVTSNMLVNLVRW